MHFAATYYDGILPHLGNCSGSERAAIFGCSLLTSYLGLFINFYLQTYKKPVKGRKPEANGNGALNGNGFVLHGFVPVSCLNFIFCRHKSD
jgi:fatty acid elongase 3